MIALLANVLALVAVLALAYFVIKGGAKLNGIKQRSGAVKIIETAVVGSRERVVVMSYNNQRYLLGVTNHTVSIIDQHDEPETVNEAVNEAVNIDTAQLSKGI